MSTLRDELLMEAAQRVRSKLVDAVVELTLDYLAAPPMSAPLESRPRHSQWFSRQDPANFDLHVQRYLTMYETALTLLAPEAGTSSSGPSSVAK